MKRNRRGLSALLSCFTGVSPLPLQAEGCAPEAPGKSGRLIILLAGIVLGQVVLYGPSLVGRKVLLPLDILTQPGVFLPALPGSTNVLVKNPFLSDLIYHSEPSRRFAVSEAQAGRLPMWNPCEFAGAPFIWPKFSPFYALQSLTRSPVILAWTELLGAIIAGLGMYLFLRRVLVLGFWPACIAAWCYPLTGFFIFWQGYPTSPPVRWLPWILLAADKTVRSSARGIGDWAAIGLSVVTALVLVSGHLDVAGQVLLASGLYAVWCLFHTFGKHWFRRQARGAAVRLAVGWMLGFLLAAPYFLPVLEYTQTSARMERRGAGEEDHPPVGLAALPQVVLPDMYGTTELGSLRFVRDNSAESSSSAYVGLLATLLVAPMAFCSRRHRAINGLWCLLAFFALSWCLNVPGFVHLFRLPGLNMMSHNRLTFLASFSILALAATGLEVIATVPLRWRAWLWVSPVLLVLLGAWCVYRTMDPPEPLNSQLQLRILQGEKFGWINDLDGVRVVQNWFVRSNLISAAWCGAGLVGGWLLWSRRDSQPRLVPALGILLVGDLLWFSYGRNVQCDPTLYFPRVPVLEEVAKFAPGRIIGYGCLPPLLAQMCGLRDVRGYDAVDPARFIDLMITVAQPQTSVAPYARTQWLIPRGEFTPEGDARLPPVLDMLGVRYLICRGSVTVGARPAFQGPDYWVLTNASVMPRVYVPNRVEVAPDRNARLEKLAAAEFDPRAVAYVEAPINLPTSCQGRAEIVSEIPTRVVVSAQMATAGLMVLADLWDKGWRAYVDGKQVPILRTNHAIRGVVIPAGTSNLEFRYQPASFVWGLRLCGLAVVVLVGWAGVLFWSRRTRSR